MMCLGEVVLLGLIRNMNRNGEDRDFCGLVCGQKGFFALCVKEVIQ